MSSFDIALVAVNARFSHSNLAVRYLRNSLHDNGFSVKIVERNINDRKEDILRTLYAVDTQKYGFSVYIWNAELIFDVASDLKKVKPDCKIIFGGPEISFYGMDFFERYPFVDVLIQGEGENALPKYLANGTDVKIIRSAPVDFIKLKFPYIDEDKKALQNKMLYYETSRGCPFSCSYCLSGENGSVQAKDVAAVKAEIARLLDFAPKVVKFTDRTFNFDRKRARELIKYLFALETDAVFHLELCAELLEDEDFELLTKAPKGRIQLEVGVQSTNPQTLNAVHRKPVSLEKLSRLSEIRNVPLHLDLIAGLPYEDYRTFQKSFNDIYRYGNVLQLGFLKLLHGTSIRQDAEKFGMVFTDKAPYEILENNFLSFGELTRLKEVEETLERFSNSGFFEHSLKSALRFFSSPFAFFEELSKFLVCHSALFSHISREMDFELFFVFGKEKSFPEEFFEALKLDYTKIFRGKASFFSYDYGSKFAERCSIFYREKISGLIPGYVGMTVKQMIKHCDIHKIGGNVYLFDRSSNEFFDITAIF